MHAGSSAITETTSRGQRPSRLLMTSVEHFEDSAEHEASEREVMEGGEGLRESLVVSGQSAEAGSPGEAAFHHPAARQQYEAALGLCVLDHLQLNAVLGGRA